MGCVSNQKIRKLIQKNKKILTIKIKKFTIQKKKKYSLNCKMKKNLFLSSCIGMNFQKPVLSSDEKIPKWLENFNFVYDFIDHKKSMKTQKKENTFPVSLKVPDKYIGKYILYWASKPSKNELKTLDLKTSLW